MKKLTLLFVSALFSVSSFAESESPNIGVTKYYGKDMKRINFSDVVLEPDGFHVVHVLHADDSGKMIPDTYRPRNGEHARKDNLAYLEETPVQKELNAAVARFKDNDCKLLLLKQFYTADVYLKRGTITAEEIDSMLAQSKKLIPDAVSFFKTSRVLSEAEVLKEFDGKIPEFAVERPNHHLNDYSNTRENVNAFNMLFTGIDFDDEVMGKVKNSENFIQQMDQTKYYDVPSSTIWLVSGQTPSGISHLPLEYTKNGLLESSARQKYKAIWEVGRAAKDGFHDEDLWFGLKAAVDQAAHEAALLGIPENEAGMVAHAANRGIKRLHLRDYGLQYLEDHPDGVGHSVEHGTIAEFRAAVEKQLALIDPKYAHLPKPTDQIKAFLAESKFEFQLANQPVHFRNFKAYRETGVSPPTTWLEHQATEAGARDPWGIFDRKVLEREHVSLGPNLPTIEVPRMDNLHLRMESFYHPAGESFSRNTIGLDMDSYMRARFAQEKALVIDFAAHYPEGQQGDWKEILDQAVHYAQDNGIKKIALPASLQTPLPPPALVRMRREGVYGRPGDILATQGNQAHRVPPADTSIYWIDVEEAARALHIDPKPTAPQTLADRYWKHALFSAEPAANSVEQSSLHVLRSFLAPLDRTR